MMISALRMTMMTMIPLCRGYMPTAMLIWGRSSDGWSKA
jgi:hypothetical protein